MGIIGEDRDILNESYIAKTLRSGKLRGYATPAALQRDLYVKGYSLDVIKEAVNESNIDRQDIACIIAENQYYDERWGIRNIRSYLEEQNFTDEEVKNTMEELKNTIEKNRTNNEVNNVSEPTQEEQIQYGLSSVGY